MLPLHRSKQKEVPDESITSASAISTRLSNKNEVEVRSFNAERAEDGVVGVVGGNEGCIDLLAGRAS